MCSCMSSNQWIDITNHYFTPITIKLCIESCLVSSRNELSLLIEIFPYNFLIYFANVLKFQYSNSCAKMLVLKDFHLKCGYSISQIYLVYCELPSQNMHIMNIYISNPDDIVNTARCDRRRNHHKFIFLTSRCFKTIILNKKMPVMIIVM